MVIDKHTALPHSYFEEFPMTTCIYCTPEWFEESFGERYLRLYAHRDSLEASTAVETLFPGHALAGRTALDLACGAGRYLRLLHIAITSNPR